MLDLALLTTPIASNCGLACCANLAVAHTGSTTLTTLLKPYSRLAHHLHQESAGSLRKKGARCFISTLRDPVERLLSAFKFEATHINWARSMHLLSRNRHTPTPAAFVDSLRYETTQSHNATWRIYGSSQPDALQWGKLGSERLEGGSGSLIPQVSYLDDTLRALVQHNDSSLHLLCTHRLSTDWAILLAEFGVGNGTVSTELHRNTGSKSEKLAYTLSEEQKEYVRHTLFPQDTELVRAVCGPEAFGDRRAISTDISRGLHQGAGSSHGYKV